ncbi:MAG: hypothetical protein M1541_08770, partial [Acidobacteria bacterium]|nr:hypothetical protein [Acidobacteriota bacterium]
MRNSVVLVSIPLFTFCFVSLHARGQEGAKLTAREMFYSAPAAPPAKAQKPSGGSKPKIAKAPARQKAPRVEIPPPVEAAAGRPVPVQG